MFVGSLEFLSNQSIDLPSPIFHCHPLSKQTPTIIT